MAVPKPTPKVIAAGVATYVATAVGAYLYLRGAKASQAAQAVPSAGDVAASTDEKERLQLRHVDSTAWSRLAEVYDRNIDMDETVMGLKLLRWWLIRKAQGNVLEVSAGTGRNLRYYDLTGGGVTSLTVTDGNKQMLQQAYDKYRSLHLEPKAEVHFSLADAQALTSSPSSSSALQREQGAQAAALERPSFGPQLAAPAAFGPGTFDCVVDTFGLCSCDDPVKALQEMARVCKPGGQLLLLEHGRGTWAFVNGMLDCGEEQHCKNWGCQWNRPIDELVQAAGLSIESLSRWHFGTTYVVQVRV